MADIYRYNGIFLDPGLRRGDGEKATGGINADSPAVVGRHLDLFAGQYGQ